MSSRLASECPHSVSDRSICPEDEGGTFVLSGGGGGFGRNFKDYPYQQVLKS